MTLYLLDTNMVRLIVAQDPEVVRRFREAGWENVWLSSVSVEEVLTGLFATINKARSQGGTGRSILTLGQAHTTFVAAFTALQQFQLAPYTDEAETIYKTFPAKLRRVGAQDCRIAALAMTRGMTVVTRNMRDFVEIGAACEDWRRPAGA